VTWHQTIWTRARAAHYDYGCNSPECCWGGSSIDDDKPCYCRSCFCSPITGPVGTGQTCPCEAPIVGCPAPSCANGLTGDTLPFTYNLYVNYTFPVGYRDEAAQCNEGCIPYVTDSANCPTGTQTCGACILCQMPIIRYIPSAGIANTHGPFEVGHERTESCGYAECTPNNTGCSLNPNCEGGTNCECTYSSITGPTNVICFQDVRVVGPGNAAIVFENQACYKQCQPEPCEYCYGDPGQCDIPRLPFNTVAGSAETSDPGAVFRHPPKLIGERVRPSFVPQLFNILRRKNREDQNVKFPGLSSIPFSNSEEETLQTGLVNAPVDENILERNFFGKLRLNQDYVQSMQPGEKAVFRQQSNHTDTARLTHSFKKLSDGNLEIQTQRMSIERIGATGKDKRIKKRAHNRAMKSDPEYRSYFMDDCPDGLVAGDIVHSDGWIQFPDMDGNFDESLNGAYYIFDPRGICVTPEEKDCPTAVTFRISGGGYGAKIKSTNMGCVGWANGPSNHNLCGWACTPPKSGIHPQNNSSTYTTHNEYYYNYNTDATQPPDFRSFASAGIAAANSGGSCGVSSSFGGRSYCSDRRGEATTCANEGNPTYEGERVLVHGRHDFYSAANILLTGSQYGAGGASRVSGFPASIPATC